MTIEQTNEVDFVTIDRDSGDVRLTISDHLPWDMGEGRHIILLQDKLNAYLRFIESGELTAKFPETTGRGIVINLVSKFSLSTQGYRFFELSKAAIAKAGFRLQLSLSAAQ